MSSFTKANPSYPSLDPQHICKLGAPVEEHTLLMYKGVARFGALIVLYILSSFPIWAHSTNTLTNAGGEFVDCALNPC